MQTTSNADMQQVACQQTWQGAAGYAAAPDTDSNIASSSIAPTAFNVSADASSGDSFCFILMEHFNTEPQP